MTSCSVSKYSGGKSCGKRGGKMLPTPAGGSKYGGDNHLISNGGRKTKSKRKTKGRGKGKGKKTRKTHRKTVKKSFLARLFKL